MSNIITNSASVRVFTFHLPSGAAFSVRTVVIDGEPWFVGRDVCDALGYADQTNAMKQHCKGVVKRHPLQTDGGVQEFRIIPERDLYRLVMRSKLESAQEFEEWVVAEVLPSIRKTGSYAAPAPAELSRLQILQLAMEAEQDKIKAEAERDEAIRTKALIGSRREATAMATASAAKREAAALREELGACARHATITAVENVTGVRYAWLPLRRWCAEHGVEPSTVPDKRYGEVKSWPADAWGECHGVDIAEVFSEHWTRPGRAG